MLIVINLLTITACGEAETPSGPAGQDASPSVIATDVPTRMTTAASANTPLRASTATAIASEAPVHEPAANTPTTIPDLGTQVPATATAAATEDPSCSGLISSSVMAIETLDMLAWASHQIVVGTVTAVSEPIMQGGKGGIISVNIFRIATVAVESRVRGQPLGEVHVLVFGGTVGACSQSHPYSPDLAVGERVLAFLQELAVTVDEVSEPILGFVGEGQGQWMIGEEDRLLGHGPEIYISDLHQPLVATLQQVRTELVDGPPERTSRYIDVVSLEDAPLAEP